MKTSKDLVFLSEAVLEGLEISTEEVITRIEHLIRGYHQSTVFNAPKSVIFPPDGRYMMSTLSAADDPPYLAVKSLILNPRNREYGLKDINALVTLLDSQTGIPLAVMDGNWITAIRTAGLSAVAAKYLARADSSSIGFIGCGVQAHSHLKAFADLFPIKNIKAFGRGSTNRDLLCQQAESMGLSAEASATAQDALSDVDLVVTSITLSPKPNRFLDARWLKPGTFAAVTDLGLPWRNEGMAHFNQIVIDDMEQETQMPEPLVALKWVTGDLTDLIVGKISGRNHDQEIVAFIFRGLALGDLALAGLAYQRSQGIYD